MILFSDRMAIERTYDNWRKKTNAFNCTFNVITFLSSMGWLDEKRIRKSRAFQNQDLDKLFKSPKKPKLEIVEEP